MPTGEPLETIPPGDGGDGADDAYRVGKGRPPLHSRFKQGRRGGPDRPKGAKNRATLFRAAFDMARLVMLNGKRPRCTAQQLAYIQLAGAAAKGDLKVIALAEQIRDKLNGNEGAAPPPELPLTEAEIAILRRRRGD